MHDIQLKSFLAAADLGSFSKAAKKLYVSAPAFTHRINMLEGELRFSLFERTSRGAVLTDSGKDFYQSTRTALEVLESSRARCLERDAKGKQVVRLACPSFSGLPKYLTAFISEFEQMHSDIKLFFVSSSWSAMVLDMSNNCFDLCFFLPIEDYGSRGFAWKELYRDQYYCVFLPSDELAKCDAVSMGDLCGRRVLCDQAYFGIPEFAALYKAAEASGAVLQVEENSFDVDGASLLSSLAEGCLFFSPAQYASEVASLSMRPLIWPRIPGGILYRKKPSPQVECFINECAAYLSDERKPKEKIRRANACNVS